MRFTPITVLVAVHLTGLIVCVVSGWFFGPQVDGPWSVTGWFQWPGWGQSAVGVMCSAVVWAVSLGATVLVRRIDGAGQVPLAVLFPHAVRFGMAMTAVLVAVAGVKLSKPIWFVGGLGACYGAMLLGEAVGATRTRVNP